MIDSSRLIIVTCVIVMTLGQILFKMVALKYNETGDVYDFGVIGYFAIAGIMYMTSSLLWVWALRSVEISRAYPYFALGFVFVPLLGAWLFGEALTLKYGLGVIFVVTGVVLTSSS